MTAEKRTAVISKKWNNPRIEIKVCVEGIGIEVGLDNYLEALVQEFGSPAKYMTVKGLRAGITAASERVISGLKKETARVM